jgi:SAM-dependent methyltransferase
VNTLLVIAALFGIAETITRGFGEPHPVWQILRMQLPVAVAPALFTWVLPGVLRYQRGGMAWIGAIATGVFTVLLGLSFVSPAFAIEYQRLHPWIYAVFTVYAAAGIALCAVGVHDRKPSARWASLGVLCLLGAAVADTLGDIGLWPRSPLMPGAFVAFGVLLGIGRLRQPADPVANFDVIASAQFLANNRTRRARSIGRKLLREGQLHFLPIYYTAMLSDLVREGVVNSGSYRFADHIYRMEPSGRGALGRWIDKMFLSMPATQAFHLRYKRAQTTARAALESFSAADEPLRMLAIPCGLPRDLTELAATLRAENPALLARIHYTGMDIDPELLRLAEDFTHAASRQNGIARREFVRGNALLAADYPRGRFHAVISTGLGEFLKDDELEVFYRNVHAVLRPGGTFFTSATRCEKRSEAFLRAFELITQYRTTEDVERILRRLPWSRLTLVQDNTGLQTFVTAVK